MSATPALEEIRAVPKVLLHDHLDGGLRPATVVELAAEQGYHDLPTTDPEELAAWFVAAVPRRDLVRYLEGFVHTVGVMQTREALERVAVECVEDLAADGIVYAEVRFAPELHTERGLSLDQVVESVLTGFDRAMAAAGANGRPIVVRTLLSAMRTADRSREIAELAVRYRDVGVAGFDVAGPEAGYPPTDHLDAFHLVQRENFHATLHAGKPSGCPRSGRRSSGAMPSGSDTGSASSTTSSSLRTVSPRSAAWPPTCATGAFLSRCAPLRTSTQGRSPP